MAISARGLALIVLCLHNIFGNPIPATINVGENNTGNIEFELKLPNNETVQIGLSFKLLTSTMNVGNDTILPLNNMFNDDPLVNNVLSTTTTPSTAFSPSINTSDVSNEDTTTAPNNTDKVKFITVKEAIEGFRQELIRKEKDIAGIIESVSPFYRHFMLEFDDDKTLPIRCTYTASYANRTLGIQCYEYRQFASERILSNGEVEQFMQLVVDQGSDVEIVNLKNMKQTYQMDIQ